MTSGQCASLFALPLGFHHAATHLGRNDEACFVRPRARSQVTAFGDDAGTSP
jgi:hypothetical protein